MKHEISWQVSYLRHGVQPLNELLVWNHETWDALLHSVIDVYHDRWSAVRSSTVSIRWYR